MSRSIVMRANASEGFCRDWSGAIYTETGFDLGACPMGLHVGDELGYRVLLARRAYVTDTEIELSGLSQRVTALHGAVVTGAAGGAIAGI